MKALIVDGKVVDVQEVEFEVHESMVWVDCPDTVEAGDLYDGSEFTSTKPTAEDIAADTSIKAEKEAAKASGYQKLLDLGLTEAEASALARYTPPSE